MNLHSRSSRFVGITASVCHFGFVLLPYHQASSVETVADTGWTTPVAVRSKSARPNRPAPVAPPDLSPLLQDAPSKEQLRRHRALAVPLVAHKDANTSEVERSELSKVLNAYTQASNAPTHKRLQHLTTYLQAKGQSPYAGALWAEVAARAELSGDFKTAEAACKSAWNHTKSAVPGGPDRDMANLAEKSLARLARLYMRTGQKAALGRLLAETAGRPAHDSSAPAIAQAKATLDWWNKDPIAGSICGITAYDLVAHSLGAPAFTKYTGVDWGDSLEAQAAKKAQEQDLIANGLSAAHLLRLISLAGGQFRLVKRVSGVEIPVPCVAHLVFAEGSGHYSALLAKDGSRTRLTDPHLRFDTWMVDEVLNSQLSGYFIVPVDAVLGAAFVTPGDEEAQHVYGRSGCPGSREPEDDCENGGCGCDSTGMATYSISKFIPGIRLYDRPVTYTPAYGPSVDFTLNYRQVRNPFHFDEVWDDVSAMSNVGPHWSHSFLSYVRAEGGDDLPASVDMRRVSSSGGIKKYIWNSGSSTWTTRNSSDPKLAVLTAGNGGPGYRLTYVDGSYEDYTQPDGGTPKRYFLKRIVDAQNQTLTLTYDTSYRLAQITDATGGITSFGYNGVDTKIISITDPYSRTATLAYNASGVLTSITDTLGITSSFGYDQTADKIQTLTTPDGTTTFQVDGTITSAAIATWSITATDPHGDVEKVESFYESAEAVALQDELTNHAPPTSISVNGTAIPFYKAAVQTGDDHFTVTFHWTKKYWGEYQKAKVLNPNVDPHEFAEATLWLMNSIVYGSASVPIAYATKKPNSAMVWYNYPGQTSTTAYVMGTDNQPIKTARQIENTTGVNTWVMTQHEYNALGLPTISTDELGRKTRKVYFSTAYSNNATWGTTVINRDVQYDQVWNGSSWLTTRTYGKYANGVPGTVTEISGRITTTTYNAKQQVTEVAVSKSTNIEKTRYTYDTDGQGVPDGQPGYLMKVERTTNAAGTIWATLEEYTYDTHGRKATETDASGYTRSFDYNDWVIPRDEAIPIDLDDPSTYQILTLDQLSLITYPDSTTEQFSYLHGAGNNPNAPGLDLTAQKDRAGRWTRYVYDEVRRLIMTITPDGLTTKQDWCKCGKIWKLTDKAGRVTEWKRDILGRVYEKIMPDGTTKTSYTYQPRSGRLATMTRPNQQPPLDPPLGATYPPTVIYSYNLNGTLQKEDYVGTDTPDVTYTYDVINRLDIATTTGLGDHDHAYEPLTSGTVGAGQIASINGPFSHDTVSRGYDWQDRHNNTVLASDTPTTLRAETRTWDTLGRLATINTTSGNTGLGTFTFNYSTNLNRVDSISAPQSLVTNYTYFPNNATGTKAQSLESITHTRSGVQYSKNVYDYDSAGRITAWDKEQTTTAAENSINSFGYNPSDEVTAYRKALASAPTTVVDQQDWAYDNAGNWLSTGTHAAMSTRTYDVNAQGVPKLNRLMSIGGAGSTVVAGTLNEFAEVTVNSQPATLRSDPVNGGYQFSKQISVAEGSNTLTVQATDKDTPPNTTTQNYTLNVGGLSRSFSYDANGNLLSDGDRTFTWDAKNRLLTVTVGGTRYRWQYDYRDRRVKEFKKVGTAAETTEKIFFWHENDLIMERNGANTATLRTYHHGGFQEGNPTVATNAKYLTTTDHLGNVREVIAANTGAGTIGDVKARYDYTTFQGPVKLSGTVDASLLTIGRYYHHAATGLELALYRAYDPVLGRWISEDPIEEKGGINLYEFIKNDPLTLLDSLGLRSVGMKNTCCVNGKEVPKKEFWKVMEYATLRACMNAQWDLLRDGAAGGAGGSLGLLSSGALGYTIGALGALGGTAFVPWHTCTSYICPKK